LLDAELLKAEFKKFPDGELYVRVDGFKSDDRVVIVQSLCSNDDLIFLTLMLDALEDVEKIAVIPYFGYARQDRKFFEGECISVRAIARIIESYTDNVISVNIHSRKAAEYFKRLSEVDAMPVIGQRYKDRDVIMISPDLGSLERVRVAAKVAGCEYDYLEKKRVDATTVEMSPKEMDVEGKHVLIVDDIISTGGTIIEASRILQNLGAKRVDATCVHAVMAGYALNKLYSSGIAEVTATDTIEREVSKISVAEKIAEKLMSLG